MQRHFCRDGDAECARNYRLRLLALAWSLLWRQSTLSVEPIAGDIRHGVIPHEDRLSRAGRTGVSRSSAGGYNDCAALLRGHF
jgi:hypothetical protein